jgi:hypothetical protein
VQDPDDINPAGPGHVEDPVVIETTHGKTAHPFESLDARHIRYAAMRELNQL